MTDQFRKIQRDELYELVWSKPTRKLAKEFGISDVALGKICKKLNVPKPPPGHWQRIAAGYKVTPPSLGKPTQQQLLEIEIRPTVQKTNAESTDPILRELMERERLPINKIVVSADLRGAHPLISHTNRVLRQATPDSYNRLVLPWNAKIEHPYLDVRVSKQALSRTLRIMDALLKAIEKRGYEIEQKDAVHFEVNGEKIRFYVNEKVKRSERKRTAAEKEHYWGIDRWIFTPTGELTFTIDEVWIERKNWRDRKDKRLEDQLNDIVVGIISAADVIRTRRAEHEEQRIKWAEEELRRQELARRRQLEGELATELEAQCDQWIKSRKLKQFLRVCENSLMTANRISNESDELQWLQWARSYADRIDPIRGDSLGRLIQKHYTTRGLA
jgi:hypothetical protein